MKAPQTPQEFRDSLTEEPEDIADEQEVEAQNMEPVPDPLPDTAPK